MIAAIYARKSTEQNVADEAKSTKRQVENATAYATRKGWAVAPEHIYIDDGISGAEFGDRRPGLAALLNALPTKPFDVLLMSEESRLGREQFKVGYILSQLADASVRVIYYLENREAGLTDASGKFMESVRSFAAEMEREKARQRTADALVRKAKSGQVCGGRTFGYDNIRTASGVHYQINSAEAKVVERIFTEYAKGLGLRGIAKLLNQDHCPAPRPSKGGPSGWSSLTIRDILKRELYRGILTYGRIQKRGPNGQRRTTKRADDQVIRVPQPALRIIPDALWAQVQQRREQAAQIYLRNTGGKLYGKPASSVESQYLLTGMALCPCGSALTIRSRSHGKRRSFYYACRAALEKGTGCTFKTYLPLVATDAAVLAAVQRLVTPDVVTAAVRRATAPDPTAEPVDVQRTRLQAQLAQVERELTNFMALIGAGGADLPSVVQEVKARERLRTQLTTALAALNRASTQPPTDPATLQARVAQAVAAWQHLATKHVAQTRQLLRKLLASRITFYQDTRTGTVRFQATGTLLPLMGLLQGPEFQLVQAVVAPTGFEPVFQP